jgi:DNA polymerase-3 subunit beta
MHVTLDSTARADITWAAKLLPTRPAVPVLAGLHLRADEETQTLTVTAFDYEVCGRVVIDAAVHTGGTLLAPGRVLDAITGRLPAGHDITLRGDGSGLTLTCGAGKYTMLTLPLEDYPNTPAPAPPAGTVDGAAFRAAVDRAVIAAGTDEALPALTGIRVTTVDGGLLLESTDRYRMVRTTLDWAPTLDDGALDALPFAPHLAYAARGLADGPVQIGAQRDGSGTADYMSFAGPTRTLTVRTLDRDEFPADRTTGVLDATLTTDHSTATTTAADLAAAVRRVIALADHAPAVELTITADQITVRAGDNTSSGTEHVPAVLNGDPVAVSFQRRYLLDALGTCPAATVHIAAANVRKAVAIRPADADGNPGADHFHLLMPVRPN